MSYEFAPIGTDAKAIKEVAELLRLVFPDSKKYTDAFIEWQYLKNPNGKIKGYNAYKNGKLAAHYAMIPIAADVFGKPERGFLSLNTATHPDHQGNKLFTTLAEMTYKLASEERYSFVVGVANANSTPGFVNKLGFQLVGPLTVKLGFGKIKYTTEEKRIDFIKRWDGTIPWRLANPSAKYKIKENEVYSVTDKTGIEAMLLDLNTIAPSPDNNVNLGFRPIKLWLGIDASIDWSHSMYFNLPNSLRPSPLNFIFKDLTDAKRKLDYQNVRFNALDFDAY